MTQNIKDFNITVPILTVEDKTLKFNPHDLVYILIDDTIAMKMTLEQVITYLSDLDVDVRGLEVALQKLAADTQALADRADETDSEQQVQDNRITALEIAQVTASYDFAIVTGQGDVPASTPDFLKLAVQKDFKYDDIVNLNNDDTEKTIFENLKTGTAEADFYSNLANATAGPISTSVTIELYDLTNEVVLDTAIETVTIPANSTITTRTRTLISEVDLGVDTAIRVSSTQGPLTGEIGLAYKFTVNQLANITDKDVTSTTTLGGPTVFDDITTLDSKITESGTGWQNAITQLKTELESMIAERELPIGTTVISPTAPTYGEWEDKGELLEGQAIIGGSTSDGEVKSHNHQWAGTRRTHSVNDGAGTISTNRIDSWNANGSPISEAQWSGATDRNVTNIASTPLYTANVGDEHNKAYGLGIGLANRLWRRIS